MLSVLRFKKKNYFVNNLERISFIQVMTEIPPPPHNVKALDR